jgi:transposase
VAATATAAVFLIHARRSWGALKALLGERVQGFVCSDRWSAYNRLSVWRRQVCWAHLKRDFQKCADRGGSGARIGAEGRDIVRRVFHEWHLFRGGSIDRPALQRRLDPEGRRLERLLRRGRACGDAQVTTFCANLLALLPGGWRFVVTEGIEPTNNHAERLLRRGVLWRKNAFGCHSAEGYRFVERLLTVVQTCQLQERPVLRYLHDALVAHRQRLPAPSLLSAG